MSTWHPQQLLILKGWSELASSYSYLHDKSYQSYRKRNLRYTLPVIIISTVTGTASFALESIPSFARPYAPATIGFFNLLAGLITTISQFLKISELCESHRVASKNFRSLARNISIELQLPSGERVSNSRVYMEEIRIELNKLLENSPALHRKFTKRFFDKFRDRQFQKPCVLDVQNVLVYTQRDEQQDHSKSIEYMEKMERQLSLKKMKLKDDVKKEMIDTLEFGKMRDVQPSTIIKNMQNLIGSMNEEKESKV